jgi:SAM-dependent methyltransferase
MPLTTTESTLTTDQQAAGTVTCPCCDRTFAQFGPSRLRGRPNTKCPNCGSKKRHRLLWLFLRNRTNLFADPLRVLHFAPESCFYTTLAALPNLAYVTADLEPGRAMLAIDITAIPKEIGTFDAILCSHVLEHVPDDQQAMRELYRVLKPGGWAVLMVPLDPNRGETFEDTDVVEPKEREQVFGQDDHVRIYGQDFNARLEHVGFSVQMHRYAKELGAEEVKKYVLKRQDQIYFCTKPAERS